MREMRKEFVERTFREEFYAPHARPLIAASLKDKRKGSLLRRSFRFVQFQLIPRRSNEIYRCKNNFSMKLTSQLFHLSNVASDYFSD